MFKRLSQLGKNKR